MARQREVSRRSGRSAARAARDRERSSALGRRGGLVTGDALPNFLACRLRPFPACDLHPLAGFQVLVVLEEMLDLVQELASETRAALIMVTHAPEDVRRVADQVVFVAEGRAEAPQPAAGLMDNPPRALKEYLG